MNKITCKNCGTDVHSGFKYCPNCQNLLSANNNKKNNSTLVIICCVVGFLMLFIIACILFSKDAGSSNEYQDSKNQTEEKEEKNEAEKEKTETLSTEQQEFSYDLEISLLDLTNYYYKYGYRQGNVEYFGKTIKTSAEFNSSDSSWPKAIYFNAPDGGRYYASCNSFKGDTFKKMSSKSKGETIKFIGKVDELISSNDYKSGILSIEDCQIIN